MQRIIIFAGWDTIEGTWTFEGKTEYNQQGQQTMLYVKRYNTETKEWEYDYKYEFEYLEDGSINETRYGWDAEAKELYQQYQKRYKYEREYSNNNLISEIKLNFVNDEWAYEYKIEKDYDGDKVIQEVRLVYNYDSWQEDYRINYEYDQWGNQVLYELYDADWYGEITERRVQAFDEKGQRIKYEWCRWEFDEAYGWFKKIGIQFYEYLKDAKVGRFAKSFINGIRKGKSGKLITNGNPTIRKKEKLLGRDIITMLTVITLLSNMITLLL